VSYAQNKSCLSHHPGSFAAVGKRGGGRRRLLPLQMTVGDNLLLRSARAQMLAISELNHGKTFNWMVPNPYRFIRDLGATTHCS
jgi:hypothetical protein